MDKIKATGKTTVAAFVGQYQTVRLTKKGHISNSQWLLYKAFSPKPLLKKVYRAPHMDDRPDDTDIFPSICDGNTVKQLWEGTLSLKTVLYISTNDGETYAFDRNIINYLARWLEGLAIVPTGNSKPAYILSNGRIAGLLMPLVI